MVLSKLELERDPVTVREDSGVFREARACHSSWLEAPRGLRMHVQCSTATLFLQHRPQQLMCNNFLGIYGKWSEGITGRIDKHGSSSKSMLKKDEEPEAQRGQDTCPGFHSSRVRAGPRPRDPQANDGFSS